MAKIIIANWKMNPVSIEEAVELAQATDYENLVMCPPFPFLKAVGSVISKAKLGAQDLFWEGPVGPFTGEVSATELKKIGVQYVIIGHSERRKNLGETDEMVGKKFVAAVKNGLIPILCVGETWEEKQSGEKEKVLKEQIKTAFQKLKIDPPVGGLKLKIYVAYEPVWAISTSGVNSHPDRPEDTLETIAFIKKVLSELNYNFDIKFIYGGSVNLQNAGDFLQHEEIEGALIGGASLKPEEMEKIITQI